MTFNKQKIYLLFIALIAALALVACDIDGADPDLDITAPTVTSTNPVHEATDAATNADITATFSEGMDSTTINADNFTLTDGETTVSGTVSYDAANATASFSPAADLAFETEYTATITTGVKDLDGNALEQNKVWTFTTGIAPDTTAPTITATNPVDGATGVAINADITATFSEGMDSTTINADNFTLTDGETTVSGTVSYDADTKTASFNPASDLEAGTEYFATITTGVKDLAGNALAADTVLTFTTGLAPDTTAPTITATSPLDGATDVAFNANITATFSEEMNSTTINENSFTLAAGSTTVAGTVSYDIGNMAAIFAPDSILNENTTYTATVTTDVTDSAGNAMETQKVWTFTTITSEGEGPAMVNLGTAGNYAILAKTTITNVPTSSITGDLGLSPAATSFITGFSLTDGTGYATSAQVTGFIYAADMAAPTPINLTTAVSNMEAAYTDAAGRSNPDYLNLGNGEIGGETLVPGLYKWGTSVTISSDVTISGNANDVWIFQISENLTTGNGINVILGGGAQAKNIFWQIAGNATVGSDAHFEGILLSSTGITLGDGTSLNGRALAQSAVILDKNTIVEPAE